MGSLDKINIRPGVSILSVLKHLNYKPWYALAEFVDNAIDSYLREKEQLEKIEGENFKLKVFIELNADEKKITIRDNAGGIHLEDYERAFRPAEIPPHVTGLSEFGMGMKSAACWFSDYWSVKTSALSEDVERRINFDIRKIVHDKIEELDLKTISKKPETHYTVIELYKITNFPIARTIAKIKDHLSSIYREFIRQEILELYFNTDPLIFSEYKILKAPFYKDEKSEPIIWKKQIDFDFGSDLHVKGFAALRETSSTSEAGFALFRNNRVIEGSADEGFRPEYIFGKSNSFRFGRLFGELHLTGFGVSHTKDGFQWDENMETFLQMLREELEVAPIPLLSQAEGFRKRPKKIELAKVSRDSVDHTTETLKKELPSVLESIGETKPTEYIQKELAEAGESYFREFEIFYKDTIWIIHLECSFDPSIELWLEVGDHLIPKDLESENKRRIGIRVSLLHPFMERFASNDTEKVEPLLRVAAAIGLAEVIARNSGVKYSSTIRANINEILTQALSKP